MLEKKICFINEEWANYRKRLISEKVLECSENEEIIMGREFLDYNVQTMVLEEFPNYRTYLLLPEYCFSLVYH